MSYLDQLEQNKEGALIDPLRALGLRFAFARSCSDKVENGSWLSDTDLTLNEPLLTELYAPCTCTTGVIPSSKPPEPNEVVGVIVDNRLKRSMNIKSPSIVMYLDACFR